MSSYSRLPCNVNHRSETRIDTNLTKRKAQKERDSSSVQRDQKNFELQGPLNTAQLGQMVDEVVRRVNKSGNTDAQSDHNNEELLFHQEVADRTRTEIENQKKSVHFAKSMVLKNKTQNCKADSQTLSLNNFEKYKKIWKDQEETLGRKTKRNNHQCLMSKTERFNERPITEIKRAIGFVNKIEKGIEWQNSLRSDHHKVIRSNRSSVSELNSQAFDVNPYGSNTNDPASFQLLKRPNDQQRPKSSYSLQEKKFIKKGMSRFFEQTNKGYRKERKMLEDALKNSLGEN